MYSTVVEMNLVEWGFAFLKALLELLVQQQSVKNGSYYKGIMVQRRKNDCLDVIKDALQSHCLLRKDDFLPFYLRSTVEKILVSV